MKKSEGQQKVNQIKFLEEKNKIKDLLSKPIAQKNINFTQDQIVELYEIFQVFSEPNSKLKFKDLNALIKTLGLDQKNPTISLIFSTLGDRYQDKEVNFEEFLEEITLILGNPLEDAGRKKMFQLFDSKKTGRAMFRDFQQLATEIGYNLSEQELKDIFSTLVNNPKRDYFTQEDFSEFVKQKFNQII